MKARFGQSPDLADATCIALALLKERFGVFPDSGGDLINRSVNKVIGVTEEEPVDEIYEYKSDGVDILEVYD
jgi:hypothetical protein